MSRKTGEAAIPSGREPVPRPRRAHAHPDPAHSHRPRTGGAGRRSRAPRRWHGQLPVADESRAGYTPDKFKHWNAGLAPADGGCHTRAEILLAEAVESPAVGAGCKLSGGLRVSYYDGQTVTDPGKLDIDHGPRA